MKTDAAPAMDRLSSESPRIAQAGEQAIHGGIEGYASIANLGRADVDPAAMLSPLNNSATSSPSFSNLSPASYLPYSASPNAAGSSFSSYSSTATSSTANGVSIYPGYSASAQPSKAQYEGFQAGQDRRPIPPSSYNQQNSDRIRFPTLNTSGSNPTSTFSHGVRSGDGFEPLRSGGPRVESSYLPYSSSSTVYPASLSDPDHLSQGASQMLGKPCLPGVAGQRPISQDRPFQCDVCVQSFNRNHDLKRHKRIHLAVKPYPCGWCDKSFSRKDALKRHLLVKGCAGPGGATVEQSVSKALADRQAASVGDKNSNCSGSDGGRSVGDSPPLSLDYRHSAPPHGSNRASSAPFMDEPTFLSTPTGSDESGATHLSMPSTGMTSASSHHSPSNDSGVRYPFRQNSGPQTQHSHYHPYDRPQHHSNSSPSSEYAPSVNWPGSSSNSNYQAPPCGTVPPSTGVSYGTLVSPSPHYNYPEPTRQWENYPSVLSYPAESMEGQYYEPRRPADVAPGAKAMFAAPALKDSEGWHGEGVGGIKRERSCSANGPDREDRYPQTQRAW